jgi:hypothetical protein
MAGTLISKAGTFVSRQEKSSWGIPCNQNATGKLFVGKGWGAPFEDQLPEVLDRVTRCLAKNRGNRNGRFWVNKGDKVVTMAVGDGAENTYLQAEF